MFGQRRIYGMSCVHELPLHQEVTTADSLSLGKVANMGTDIQIQKRTVNQVNLSLVVNHKEEKIKKRTIINAILSRISTFFKI